MSSLPSPRRVGAPAGNRNALKHGFYSAQYRRRDLTDLDVYQPAGLSDEINLLRVHIRRVVELGAEIDQLPQSIDLLRVLCLASTSLTRLLKAHAFLAAGPDEIGLAIQEVYNELVLPHLPHDEPHP
jgi:hypothetical protein